MQHNWGEKGRKGKQGIALGTNLWKCRNSNPWGEPVSWQQQQGNFFFFLSPQSMIDSLFPKPPFIRRLTASSLLSCSPAGFVHGANPVPLPINTLFLWVQLTQTNQVISVPTSLGTVSSTSIVAKFRIFGRFAACLGQLATWIQLVNLKPIYMFVHVSTVIAL